MELETTVLLSPEAPAELSENSSETQFESAEQAETNSTEPTAGKTKPVEPKPTTGKKRPPADNKSVGLIALPVQTSQLIKKYSVNHPGLVLNKYPVLLRLQDRRLQYSFSADQKNRILQKAVHLLASNPQLKEQWEQAHKDRQSLFELQKVKQFSLQSVSPVCFSIYHPFAELGLELHPLYGFPIISAMHIKGALKQFVLNTWLPQQTDAESAQATIQAIFGASGSRTDTQIQKQSAQIVWHDAWPEQWPQVGVEVAVKHHAEYYQRQDFPGDWQSPQQESFLYLKAGAQFGFALSKAAPDVSDTLLETASNWLLDLLQHQGLGAYRQQGFGIWQSKHPTESSVWQTRLSLVSPAFVAGSSQRSEDCYLRSGTLKGLLRYWWRSLYAGYLSHRELLALEGLIWGNPHRKGAVRLVLKANPGMSPRRYRPEELVRLLPGPEGERRSPGLVYLGYGLFGESSKRYYLGSDAYWDLQLEARDATWLRKEGPISISADIILQQAQAALFLLSQYGGIGQRKRKGFGSLQVDQQLTLNLEQCLDAARQLREHCNLHLDMQAEKLQSPGLGERVEVAEINTPWKNPWFALHQIGESLQSYMQQHKHEAIKLGLGLPRQLGQPITGEFELADKLKQRHAAPYTIHLSENAEHQISIRLAGWPSNLLPNLEQSKALLTELLTYLQNDLTQRVAQWPNEPELKLQALPKRNQRSQQGARSENSETAEKPARKFTPRREGDSEQKPKRFKARTDGPKREFKPQDSEARQKRSERFQKRTDETAPSKFKRSESSQARSGPRQTQAGDWVQAILLEERTKKGGWRAQHTDGKGIQLGGPIVNTGLVPGEHNVGDSVELIIHSLNKFEMMFRWPTESERVQKDQPKAKARFAKKTV